MDDLRQQQYIALVEQILCCPRGEEMLVLQRHLDLLDAELIVMMKQSAERLCTQGNEQEAGWLLGLSVHLEKGLGLGTENKTGTAHAMRFLSEILQLVAESNGNPQEVYPIWKQQQKQLNIELLAVFPTVIMPFLESNAEYRESVALMLVRFGNLIQKFPWGEHWLNLELGILAYELALQVCTRDSFEEQWATTQNNLSIAYSERIHGEKADNLEKAIVAYNLVLKVRTRGKFPEDWAATQNNLAATYVDRIRGDRADNLELAITGYNLALQVRTRDAFPESWATTQNNLANAYNNTPDIF